MYLFDLIKYFRSILEPKQYIGITDTIDSRNSIFPDFIRLLNINIGFDPVLVSLFFYTA